MSDVFISYVSRDKEFVQALIDALSQQGVKITDGRLRLGDSLSGSIREGLKNAPYAILILSKAFFDKSWPRFEFEEVDKLDSAFEGPTKLLPIWHGIDQQKVSYFAPEFAHRMGVSSEYGMDEIVEQISEVVQTAETGGSAAQTLEGTQSSAVFQTAPVQKSLPSNRNSLLTLRDNLNTYFSLSEIRTLCFDLGIDYEDLGGDSKNDKVMNLVQFMQRHGRLQELEDLVRQERPYASW